MAKHDFGTIVQIGDILVSEDVILEFFACDYAVCKGVCCIEGDSGAPLDESELPGIERHYDSFKSLMTPNGKAAVAEKGFFEIDIQGDIVTPLANGGPECAYCHFPGDGNCLCSIEKAGFKKPVSCSLYPIRVTRLTGGGLALNLHRWNICSAAYEKGRKTGTRVYEFLKGPLSEAFGEEFYNALEAAATHLLKEDC
ncbi:MAG: DUF3109 family protein [Bacteroidales bacterium]|nr:DUF3109 family protein [Bacteroidales bacterium]